ncbi:MAG: OstA-like protein [Bacteroidaceae bacterium]|nr:hypothetical protein [Bacteroidaceae bacterium]
MRKIKNVRLLSKYRWPFFCLFCLFFLSLVAQNKKQPSKEKKTKIFLLHADLAKADKLSRPGVQELVGTVKMRHDSMYMYCDSALIYENTNSVEAFSNVRMEQGDTLFIYGDYLDYDGATKLAKLRGSVKLVNKGTTLLTDSLNYDRMYDLCYYFMGGVMMDENNVLTSQWGEYSPATHIAVFNHNVKLNNPKFVLTSDTLRYNTVSKIATILGPSYIVSDSNHIYSERGIYNTLTDQGNLLGRSILRNEGKTLTGDSLYYNRKIGYGEAFGNVVMNDSIKKSMLTGDYCYLNELTDSAFCTKRAVGIDYSEADSLFLHADTLTMVTFNMNTDSMYRLMKAYHKVRAYRESVQAQCDSLVYNSKDSCIMMYKDPILWSGKQQLLGEEINLFMNDSTVDHANIINQALAIEQKDSIHYNQVSSKLMNAYFVKGEMRHVEMIGNVLIGFYPEEKDSTMLGYNNGEGSLLHIYLKDKKMEKAKMIGKSNGTLYPMSQIPVGKLKLPTFAWFDYARPLNKNDIFNWRGKKESQQLKKTIHSTQIVDKRELVKMK